MRSDPPKFSSSDEFDLDLIPEGRPQPRVSARSMTKGPLVMVETAFLASTTALIWLINAYLPLGPLLRMFFPIPIALAYLRWGKRAAWMTTLVATLLISVLMGPPRSLLFLVPSGLIGMTLGRLWRRRASWGLSMAWGVTVSATGLLFQLGLLSMLLGTNLWLYLTRQVTGMIDWVMLKLGLLLQPDVVIIQVCAIGLILVNATLYILLVHLVAWMLLERLETPIPDPPDWLQALLED